MNVSDIIMEIIKLKKDKKLFLIAVDGRCGGGKTTLAKELQKHFICKVIHMDSFFLRPEQRTAERLSLPGGNTDRERFLSEVLIPLKEGKSFSYRPYSCKKQSLEDPVFIKPEGIVIVEGSYCCHPELWDYYDLHIFVDINEKAQLERLEKREGKEKTEIFKNKWIPLEENYFKAFSIREKAEIAGEITNT